MNFNMDNIKIEQPTKKRFSEDSEKQDRYLKIIEKNSILYTPKPDDFQDLYSKVEIEQDLRAVEIRKRQFKENQTDLGLTLKKVSDVYEGVIVEQAEQNEWFGEGVSFYPTSEFDDIVNGVDGVAEFTPDDDVSDEYLALSFDVVFSTDPKRILKKLERTKMEIKEGRLTEVKYFEDAKGTKKSIKAPRLVLGSRLTSAEKLIDLWGGSDKNKNKKLAQHPVQIKLLLESYLQLNHFAHFAHKIGEIDISVAYTVLGNRIAKILNSEKQELMTEVFQEVSDDIVFETIREYCNDVEI